MTAPDTALDWLYHADSVGLVVAPRVLQDFDLVPQSQTAADTAEAAAIGDRLSSFWPVARLLGWPPDLVAGAPDGRPIPDDLRVHLPESDTTLQPHLAVSLPDRSGWQLLVRHEAAGIDADTRGSLPGWEATPHQRFERLLRETGVGAGLLVTDTIRLVYAPRGETSGWLTFPLAALGTVPGRTLLAGLKLLLGPVRLFTDPPERRLPALLAASRRAQAAVSTALAGQVLGALHELLRGLHAAEPAIAELARTRPAHLYEGLLAVLMRLVFLLYAEDRDLVPSRADPESRAFYDQGYGVRALHARLLDDQARLPDTMDERRGAWGQLLALFRLVHQGCGTGWMRPRGGKLFDPATFPFLLGQTTTTDKQRVPLVTDGCILRILDRLMVLGGERLSYRALDVEQIGSVYETVMGFTVQPAPGASIAIRAGKKDRTPVFVDLPALLASRDRVKYLKDYTDRGKFPPKVDRDLKAAATESQLAAALASIVDPRGSPDGQIWPTGTPLLQPTDERRRTGSHYTPRDLTNPIVTHALAPAFARLGPAATPDDILALKVCDPAMGSGAFLVEACRQLAFRLVDAWARHPGTRPPISADEDEELLARRLIAQRCLYGVDRNPMATDLARLSLWLATLARDHEFTFLDHALRTGDSLVGLTRAQVDRLDWRNVPSQGSLFGALVSSLLAKAVVARTEIRAAGDDVAIFEQERRFAIAENNLADLRLAGDAVIAIHFSSERNRTRVEALDRLHETAIRTDALWGALRVSAATLATGKHKLRPFHWELEFPEVFAGDKPGFDAIVGNPPFAGKNTLLAGNRDGYLPWLKHMHEGAHGNADLVAHFFRRTFGLLRPGGCLGLIATNTIGQGDTRETGLRWLLESGGTIIHAIRRVAWPGEAAVVVSVVHVVNGELPPGISPILEGRQARRISAYLVEGDLDASPARLAANQDKAFIGCFLLGLGFTFDDEAVARGKPASPVAEMHRLIAKDPRNAERIFPYLGGEEVNTDPRHAHRRWVIDFNDFPLGRREMDKTWAEMDRTERSRCRAIGLVPLDYPEPVAEEWPDLLGVLREKVKPERDILTEPRRHTFWWQFCRPGPALRRAINGLEHIDILSRVSAFTGIATITNGIICAETTVVFADDRASFRAILQSRLHEVWAAFFSSSLEDRLRYGPSDCFENFPLPSSFDTDDHLTAAGSDYHDLRAAMMTSSNKGLTKILGQFHKSSAHGPDVAKLRALHHTLDLAVFRAYGWHDLAEIASPLFLTPEEEPEYRYQKRLFWPAPFRDEVLARLLALNAERAAEEATAGLVPPPPAEEIETEEDDLVPEDADA